MESFAPRIQDSGDSSMNVQTIIPTSSVVYTSVPVYGTQLGIRSLTPLGRLHLMRPLQQHFSCSESVRPVYIATGGTYMYLFSFRAYWAAGQLIDPFGPTAAQIATFLYFLLDTHSLSPQNYQGYRFCLASFLNWTVKTAAIKN